MNKLLGKIVWIFILAPFGYLALAWKNIPSKIPMRFNWQGEVDRFGNKTELLFAVFLLTAVNIGTWFLLINAYRIDPKKQAYENKEKMKSLAFAISLFIAAILCLLIHTAVTGSLRFMPEFVLAGTGILFAVIGNYMHSIRPNYFAGLRLPWILENEENWRRTHQLAGKLWFAGGLVIAVSCLFLPKLAGIIVFGIILVTLIIIPVIYSYRLYKKLKETH